jgi:hypothetical protein
MLEQAILQATSPCNPQFSVDVDHIDPGGDCLPEIFIVVSTTVDPLIATSLSYRDRHAINNDFM